MNNQLILAKLNGCRVRPNFTKMTRLKLAKSILRSVVKNPVQKAISALQSFPADPIERLDQVLFLISILIKFTENNDQAELLCRKAIEFGADRLEIFYIQLEIWYRMKKFQFGLKMIELERNLDNTLLFFQIKYYTAMYDSRKLRSIFDLITTRDESELESNFKNASDQVVSDEVNIENNTKLATCTHFSSLQLLFALAQSAIKLDDMQLLDRILNYYKTIDYHVELEMTLILRKICQGTDCSTNLAKLHSYIPIPPSINESCSQSYVNNVRPDIMACLLYGMSKKGSDPGMAMKYFDQGLTLVKAELEDIGKKTKYQWSKSNSKLPLMQLYLELNMVEVFLIQRQLILAAKVVVF